MDSTSRNRALRACAVVEPGLEPVFDRLARLAVLATRAPVCAVLFGDEALVKGYSGPKDGPMDVTTGIAPLYDALLSDDAPKMEARDGVAGAAILDPNGIRVGAVCVRTATPRTWTPEALEALADVAGLARTELSMRTRRLPSEATASVLENVTDACVFLDRDFRYTFVNRKAGEAFHREPASLIGKHIWTEFPEGVGQPFYLAYNRAIDEQVPIQIEEFYPPWNRWFENRIYPSPDGLAIFFQDVTDRRQAELYRRRLATIVETETDLVGMFNRDGKLLYLNPAGRKITGLSNPAESDAHLASMHAPACRDLICEAMNTVKEGAPWSGEASLARGTTAKVPVVETLTWHEGEEPDGGFYSLVSRDITERKRAEEARHRDELFKAQAGSLAHLGYWVWEIRTNRVTWSSEMFEIYGLDQASFAASFEGYLSRLHPEDRDRVRRDIEHALRDCASFTFEERIVRPGGELRHLRTWGSVNVDEGGQPVEMFGTCLDVTELVQATEALRRSEEWLSTALRTTRVAVWEWNVRTNDVKLSQGAAGILGLEEGDLGVSFDAYLGLVHPEDRAGLMEALRVSVEAGDDFENEHRFLAPGQSERWIVARARARRGEAGRVDRLVGTLVDVTERHHVEKERRLLLEKLAHSQKMEAVGRLSAGVAHDFNNQLTVILGSVEHLLRATTLDAFARDCVTSIEEACRACIVLTKELLAFSRDQSRPAKLGAVDLNEAVRAACKLLARLLPDNVRLELSLAPGLAKVESDRGQLERVLLNLMSNARDAMPDGGCLFIETRGLDGQAVLEVRDTGVGMSAEVRERVFEPFFTTKAAGIGTGLGLSTVYGIVSQNGSIEVKSEVGAGTVFTIKLPFAK